MPGLRVRQPAHERFLVQEFYRQGDTDPVHLRSIGVVIYMDDEDMAKGRDGDTG